MWVEVLGEASGRLNLAGKILRSLYLSGDMMAGATVTINDKELALRIESTCKYWMMEQKIDSLR